LPEDGITAHSRGNGRSAAGLLTDDAGTWNTSSIGGSDGEKRCSIIGQNSATAKTNGKLKHIKRMKRFMVAPSVGARRAVP